MKQKQKNQITGKEIISLQKKLKKSGLTVNDALIFLFKEMIDTKSSQIQMQMSNGDGQDVELSVILSGEGLVPQSSKKEPRPNCGVPMIS